MVQKRPGGIEESTLFFSKDYFEIFKIVPGEKEAGHLLPFYQLSTTFSRTAEQFPVEIKQIPPLLNSRTPEDKFPVFCKFYESFQYSSLGWDNVFWIG